jgi:hypothetical protein
LRLLFCLLLLVLVVSLLYVLWGLTTLAGQLSAWEKRAWRSLWVESLVFVGGLWVLNSRLVALVLLLLLVPWLL